MTRQHSLLLAIKAILPGKTILVLILISLAGIGAGVWFSQNTSSTDGTESASRSRVLEKPRPLSEFTLSRHDQGNLNKASFVGKWSFLFFGYTHCPDICPTTLAELGRTFKQGVRAYPELSDTQAIFVSVDPQRDTPESIAAYVKYFDPDFIAATGNETQLNGLTEQLGIKYSRGPAMGDGYAVNHTSAVLLIDPQARYYAYFIPPHYALEVFQEYVNIRNHYESTQ